MLHEEEHSVARDQQIQQITAEFDMGPAGLIPGAKLHFLRGLQSLLRQQPAYQTAWLLRIQAAWARADRSEAKDNVKTNNDAMNEISSTRNA
jgi:hypothetical protein